MKSNSKVKKFIAKLVKDVVLATVMTSIVFSATGCKKDDADVDVQNGPATYGQTDFALYTVDDEGLPSKFLTMLGIDESTVQYNDDSAEYMSEFIETQTLDVLVADEENPGQNSTQKQIRYIYFKGSHTPVINVKGIKTTGPVLDDETSSTVQDVINAYDIDTENEGYIELKREDGSYTIRLNFSAEDSEGKIERIKNKVDEDPAVTTAKYAIRFDIINEHVHGIEYYMYY